VRDRVSVRRILGPEIVALDGAGETLALGRTDDIDALPRLEVIDLDLCTGRKILTFRLAQSKLPKAFARSDARALEMAGEGL